MPSVSPEILIWARETAGLSLADAARKLGFSDSARSSGAEKLESYESGSKEPSRALLLKMTKQYRRSLAAFYLARVPEKGNRGSDFRTLPDAPAPEKEALIDALVRDIQARQSMVKASLLDEEPHLVEFVASASMQSGVGAIVREIKTEIGFDRDEFRRKRSPEEAFATLRSAVEARGVFVLLVGNLGSHHTAIEPSVFRGFALADPVAPFIVINDQDAKAAWSFTLLHELVHLWLGETGISGAIPGTRLERFCNDVASEILVSTEELADLLLPPLLNLQGLTAAIADFAKPRKVSYSMVAYRLFLTNRISEATWLEATAYFRAMWFRERARARERAREDDAGGPSYYIVRRHKLGGALLSLVRGQVEDGALSPVRAARILGVRPRNVFALLGEGPQAASGGAR